MTVFATVIALTKDMADIAGDRQFNIQTFATQLGANRLALLGGSSSDKNAGDTPPFGCNLVAV